MKQMAKVSNGSKECCGARDVLWYLVFFGFAVNYMIRINLNIAIVSMVKSRGGHNITPTGECLRNMSTSNYINHSMPAITFPKPDENLVNISKLEPPPHNFEWNEKQQSNILGAFFWLHWLTQIPGGIYASKYGTKLIFGLSNLTAVLCCFLIPMFANMGHEYLIGLRIVQGLLAGSAWPSMHNMTARWIPPNERSKFVTAYLGSSVGAALTFPVCGFIIHKWGWEWAFHTCGIAGTVWFVAWWFLVYDSPTKHPRISQEEKQYILDSLGQTYTQQKAPVPWKSIIFSKPVWMNVLAQWGGIWGLFTLMTHSPTYFKFIHGWSIQATGLLAGLGHVLRTTWSYLCGLLCDYLLRTNKMNRTNVRKLATAGCTICEGLCLFGLAFCGCNYTWAVIWLSAAVAMNGSVSAGPLASVVDISPNYASVVLGIVNSVVALVGFITPAVVGEFTYQNQTVGQWQKVFLISGAMAVGVGIIFVIFAKSELQPWNSPDKLNRNKESELISMNNKEENKDEEKVSSVTIKQ